MAERRQRRDGVHEKRLRLHQFHDQSEPAEIDEQFVQQTARLDNERRRHGDGLLVILYTIRILIILHHNVLHVAPAELRDDGGRLVEDLLADPAQAAVQRAAVLLPGASHKAQVRLQREVGAHQAREKVGIAVSKSI